MGISLDRIRAHTRHFVTSGTASEDIILSTPNASLTVNTTGYVTKHWISFDSDGGSINSKNAHICLDEKTLTYLGYPVRNSNEEIYLFNHRISVKDSSGVLKEFVIKEWFPSETFGLIACILGDYGDN